MSESIFNDDDDNDTPVEKLSDSGDIVASDIDFEFEAEKLLRSLEANLQEEANNFELEELAKADTLESLSKEEDLLRARLAAINTRRRQFDNSKWDYQKKMRKIEADVEDAKRMLAIEQANLEAKQDLEKKAILFDEVTATAKWRDYAMPHQITGAHFIADRQRVIVADSMGLGKTLQSAMAADMLDSKKILIVCPGDVRRNFVNEYRKWTTRSIIDIGNKSKAIQEGLLDLAALSDKCVVIVNYEAWSRSKVLLKWINAVGFDTVIMDEAHGIKDMSTSAYKGCKEIVFAQNACSDCRVLLNDDGTCPKCITYQGYGKVSTVVNVIPMTGTPILNRPDELFALLSLVHPELFYSRNTFIRNFCETGYDGKVTYRPGGQASLAQRISAFYLRRTLDSAGIILPPQERIVHEIELDTEEYSLQYEILKMLNDDAKMKIDEDSEIKVFNMLALITRQRQAAVWPGGITIKQPQFDYMGEPEFDDEGKQKIKTIDIGQNYKQSVKLDKAVDLFHELVEDGHRVVFFSQFKSPLIELQHRFDVMGDKVASLHGDTSKPEREIILNNFDKSFGEESKWDGVLCNYRVGGVGVNLTAATAVIVLDEEWNAGKESQAFDRVHRIGQDKETQVHILRVMGGLAKDEWMADLIEYKKKLVAGFDMSMTEYRSAFE